MAISSGMEGRDLVPLYVVDAWDQPPHPTLARFVLTLGNAGLLDYARSLTALESEAPPEALPPLLGPTPLPAGPP